MSLKDRILRILIKIVRPINDFDRENVYILKLVASIVNTYELTKESVDTLKVVLNLQQQTTQLFNSMIESNFILPDLELLSIACKWKINPHVITLSCILADQYLKTKIIPLAYATFNSIEGIDILVDSSKVQSIDCIISYVLTNTNFSIENKNYLVRCLVGLLPFDKLFTIIASNTNIIEYEPIFKLLIQQKLVKPHEFRLLIMNHKPDLNLELVNILLSIDYDYTFVIDATKTINDTEIIKAVYIYMNTYDNQVPVLEYVDSVLPVVRNHISLLINFVGLYKFNPLDMIKKLHKYTRVYKCVELYREYVTLNNVRRVIENRKFVEFMVNLYVLDDSVSSNRRTLVEITNQWFDKLSTFKHTPESIYIMESVRYILEMNTVESLKTNVDIKTIFSFSGKLPVDTLRRLDKTLRKLNLVEYVVSLFNNAVEQPCKSGESVTCPICASEHKLDKVKKRIITYTNCVKQSNTSSDIQEPLHTDNCCLDCAYQSIIRSIFKCPICRSPNI